MNNIIKVGNWWVVKSDKSVQERSLMLEMPLANFQWQTKKPKDQSHRGDLLSYIRRHERFKNVRHSTYVDVGAAYGFTSVPLTDTFTQIIAVEPMPVTFKCLLRNARDYPNIHCINFALSNRLGFSEAIYKPTHAMISQLQDQQNHQFEQRVDHPLSISQQVATMTLDQLIHREIDCLKIDVEGHQLQVLQGAALTLKKSNCLVIVEQTDHQDKQVEQLMHEYGYSHVDTLYTNDFVYKRKHGI